MTALETTVTRYLRWDESLTGDADSMARLGEEIAAAKLQIADLCAFDPAAFAWEADASARERMLLCNLVLYMESNAADEFEGNYVREIQQARSRHVIAGASGA